MTIHDLRCEQRVEVHLKIGLVVGALLWYGWREEELTLAQWEVHCVAHELLATEWEIGRILPLGLQGLYSLVLEASQELW